MRSISPQDFEKLILLYMEGLSWTKAVHKTMQETESLKADSSYDQVLNDLQDYNTRAEATLKKFITEEDVSA